MAGLTPSQTVGPYFAYGLTPAGRYDWNDAFSTDLVTADAVGEHIRIEGCVVDGDGEAIPDAMIEIWQADGQGRFVTPDAKGNKPNTSFRGFGRCGTDNNGGFHFKTVKPGPVAGPDGKMQAPHVMVCYFSRGLLTHLFTRIYFEGESANATDPVLSLVPADRRDTLIAKKQADGSYRFDIFMQGEKETVFFAV